MNTGMLFAYSSVVVVVVVVVDIQFIYFALNWILFTIL